MSLFRFLPIFLLVSFAAGAVAAERAPIEKMDVWSRPITEFHIGRADEKTFGPLQFVGGLEMTASGRDFGALSALRFRDGGKDFVGVADTGFWYFGTMKRDGSGRPVGVSDFRMVPMVDATGQVIGRKWLTDAESLDVDGDTAIVGFERDHRIAQFRLDPENMQAPRKTFDFLIPTRELRQNKSFETVARGKGRHDGELVVLTERSLDADGNISAAVIAGPKKGIFAVRRLGDFDISDGVFLPDGDLLILERSYTFAAGVRMRLRRLASDTIAPGALADGPILMEADMGYQIDNMEGIDVWTRGDGATMVSLISDDNHSLLQRNLYLEFILKIALPTASN